MKYLFFLFTGIFTLSGNNIISAQIVSPIHNYEINMEGQPSILVGKCSKNAFQKPTYASWFNPNYQNYLVDSSAIITLTSLRRKIKIELFMGTWCGDSKREVPNMLKILDAAGFDSSVISIICLSNQLEQYKKSPQGEEIGKNIVRVPTIIVYYKRKEIGRIIESPVISLEKDLIRIIKQDGYIPHYADLQSN